MDPTDIPAGAEPIEPRRFRGNKLLVGCAGVAIALVIIAIAAGIAFMSWIRTPGVPLEGRLLVDRDTALYAEVHVRAEDQAVKEFLSRALSKESQEAITDDAEMPEPLRWVFGGSPREATLEDLEKALPLIVMFTRQEAGEGVGAPGLLSVSFPRFGNRLRMVSWFISFILGWSEGEDRIQSYRDESLLEIDADGFRYWVSIVGSNFLMSRVDAPIKWGIDRIKDSETATDASGGSSLLNARPDDALLYMSTRPGFGNNAVRLVERGTPEFASILRPLVQDAGGFTLWAGLETPDLLVGEIHVAAGSPEEDEADEYSGTFTSVLPAGQLTMSLEPLPKRSGERHAWRVRISGLEAVALRTFEFLEELDRD
jgi:hypothetical protein